MRQLTNWKTILIFIALAIFATSLYYTNQLAKVLGHEEKQKVEMLVQGIRVGVMTPDTLAISYTRLVVDSNKTIPLILTDEADNIQSYINLDTTRAKADSNYLKEKLLEFKTENLPIVNDFGFGKQLVYYGESHLLKQLRYFPYVQLTIILLFLLVVLIALSTAHRSIQNQVWVGLSKETAHQLGTPLSAIEGWLELIRDLPENHDAATEMQKDLDRLKLVADRFSKVGSTPELYEENLIPRLEEMVAYMQRRSPAKVKVSLQSSEAEVPVLLSGELFDWVIENLVRNALDSMQGSGSITITVMNAPTQVTIDVSDTGKGIPRKNIKKVFSPGFTTKKRGWGLGLSLARRIIERYHHGSIYVRHSELGKGTTFRIILRR